MQDLVKFCRWDRDKICHVSLHFEVLLMKIYALCWFGYIGNCLCFSSVSFVDALVN